MLKDTNQQPKTASKNITEEILDFDDELQNLISDHSRSKRATRKRDSDEPLRTVAVGSNLTELLVNDLDHFSSYSFSIRACREGEDSGSDLKDELCGFETQVVAKTSKSHIADLVSHFNVELVHKNDTNKRTSNSVKVSWTPPANPNGPILNYVVRQRKVSDEKSKIELVCISMSKRFNLSSQLITNVGSGNISFEIAAMTLAGRGNFTSSKYVYIPSPSHFGIIASPPFLTLLFLIVAAGIAIGVYKVYKRNQPSDTLRRFDNFDSQDHIIE